MLNGFQTDDMREVFSNLLQRLQETEDEEIETVSSAPEVTKQKAKPKAILNKSIPVSSVAEKSSTTSKKKIKAKEFASTTLARMTGIAQKTKDKIKRLTEQKKEKEMQNVQKAPKINSSSRELGRRGGKIYERAEKEISQTQQKIEEKKKVINEEREKKIQAELTFKPKILTNEREKRTLEEFYEYNLEWKNRNKRRIDERKAEIEEKLLSELKFTPQIDENSQNLVEQMGQIIPIEKRLYERKKVSEKRLLEKRKQYSCSFTPEIIDKSRRLARKKVKKHEDEDVFNRLFNLSIDSLPDKSPKFGGLGKSSSFSFTMFGEGNKSLDITFN
ncbi:hypothetical protein SteCoe_21723 [Stentor coeruleus]|uniref:Uncharacterized protein n=1 Tax=Stentor coeruleus TaxID=5963 RepID=A0A1R2BNY7_9CILI|nr:hypothetical protein SteCoe_21723 [Stentor coeruleus]